MYYPSRSYKPRRRRYARKAKPVYRKPAYRRPAKKTRLFRKRKSSSIHAKVQNAGANGSTFQKTMFGSRLCSKRVALIKKLGSRNQFTYTQSAIVLSAIGKQNYGEFPFTSFTDLKAMADAMGIGGDNSDSNKNTNDWVLGNQYNKIEISNQGSSMAYVDLYLYVCRRDTDSTPSELWLEGNQEQQGNAGVTLTQPGLVPIGHDRISTFYKMKKVIHHSIKPGETHTQVIEINHNKLVHNELLWAQDAQDTGAFNLGGYTYYMLAVCRGSGAAEAETDAATIAPSSVVFTFFKNLTATWLADQNNNLRYDNFIPQTGHAQQYNQGSGQQEAVNVVAP